MGTTKEYDYMLTCFCAKTWLKRFITQETNQELGSQEKRRLIEDEGMSPIQMLRAVQEVVTCLGARGVSRDSSGCWVPSHQ